MDESFYATDMEARGFCDEWVGCEAFSPSSATVKASSFSCVAYLNDSGVLIQTCSTGVRQDVLLLPYMRSPSWVASAEDAYN